MAELVFWSGTMDCGKSTLALQIDPDTTVRRLAPAFDQLLTSQGGMAIGVQEQGSNHRLLPECQAGYAL